MTPGDAAFHDAFGQPAEAWAEAPGRVNLLGEHTDYNDGFVLPTPIPQQARVGLAASRDGVNRFRSAQLTQVESYGPDDAAPRGFGRYVHGCREALRSRGHVVPALSVYVDSRVPIGAGLSSSAALEVAVLRALRTRFDLPLDDVDLAVLAQVAEVDYAGVRCGIMDQMAASVGRPGEMLFLDTRSLERRLLPLPAGTALLVVDSGVSRSLAHTGYNERRAECERAAVLLGVRSLRDASDLRLVDTLPEPLNKRVRHVLSENARVLQGTAGVDAPTFGRLMDASHASLRDDYEVSIPALDTLVAHLQGDPRVFGARLTGAGFGGACVALVEQETAAAAAKDLQLQYARGAKILVGGTPAPG